MTFPTFHAEAVSDFHPAPSVDELEATQIQVSQSLPKGAGSIGIAVGVEGEVPREVGLNRTQLAAAGFEGKVGQALVIPRAAGPAFVVVGIGAEAERDVASLRHAAAAFARAGGHYAHLVVTLPDLGGIAPDVAAQAIVEGVLLARYRYRPLKRTSQQEPPLEALTLLSSSLPLEEVKRGVERGRVTARAAELARDLSNAPATLLTARRFEEIARVVAASSGLDIEVFDEKALSKLGCGGMLGVNAGSAEPPRLIKLSYQPKDARGQPIAAVGRVSLVGKGIMYDSGGLGLKPNDLVHAAMKTDMSGAAAILAAMSALSSLGARSSVTGYLMCTDNMPGGKAMRLGDVLTARGGKTIEVLNTDAEGRLVMMDGLVLATEEQPPPDAILDIATLTGACERALGNDNAGVIGNHQGVVDQVRAAAEKSDETVWQFPLDRRLRKELDSEVADLKNVGGVNAGQITAALFLEEFVAGIPWAHIDMAGTSRVETDKSWRSKGATGYGTRLLIEFLLAFSAPRETRH
ncbi:leucyl aminopeptidase [Corallococcus llansteffanensis]|uniref:Probable cytosol aminopeptidase n=1 Tax=Corallococcus llansteffanensis TaxID=2316731 RepID=A0A3A8NXG0_9BACT|nr:leucyl aminopeptidase [Corallococcus llansteffanensis]RKH47820.1 leucyl aminopeptidase [Corallococcus llansteffanensis]